MSDDGGEGREVVGVSVVDDEAVHSWCWKSHASGGMDGQTFASDCKIPRRERVITTP